MMYDYSNDELQKAVKYMYKRLTDGKSPVDAPRAVLLGGQSGSGKTTIHNIEQAADPNVIIINGDGFRTKHPLYEKICQAEGDDFVKYTQDFANELCNELIARLSDEGYNLVIEGTLRTTEVPLASYNLLKGKGYTVELAIMATPKETSWQGTIERYNQMLLAGYYARATTKESHDTIVNNIVPNLQKLYKMHIFDNIVIYDREENCLYDMSKTPNADPSKILHDKIFGLSRDERGKKK